VFSISFCSFSVPLFIRFSWSLLRNSKFAFLLILILIKKKKTTHQISHEIYKTYISNVFFVVWLFYLLSLSSLPSLKYISTWYDYCLIFIYIYVYIYIHGCLIRVCQRTKSEIVLTTSSRRQCHIYTYIYI